MATTYALLDPVTEFLSQDHGLLIGGEEVRSRERRAVRGPQSRRRNGAGHGSLRGTGGRRRRRQRGPRCLSCLARPAAGPARRPALAPRDTHPRARGRVRRARDARQRQADRRRPTSSTFPLCVGAVSLLRGLGDEDRGPVGNAVLRQLPHVHAARAGRGGRRDHPVELPAPHVRRTSSARRSPPATPSS